MRSHRYVEDMSTRSFSTARGGAALLAGAILSVTALAGCGSGDEDVSAEEAFCEAGDNLRADFTSLTSLDLLTGGTSALNERVDAIEADLKVLQESGSEVASEEIDALQISFDELNSAVDALGENMSIANASAIVEAITKVASSASAAYEVFTTTCS